MRYVVTGGSGFIGSHLVDLLLKTNVEVVIVDKIMHSSRAIKKDKVIHYFADISDNEVMNKIIQKDDVIFHLSAQSHVDVSYNNPLGTIQSNILGTQAVLSAFHSKKASKLIVMSTDEVYGSVDSITDNSLLDPTNPYSASKAAADMLVNAYKHMNPDRFVCTLRSNNIVGPRQFVRNIIPRFTLQLLFGKKITLHGKGNAKRRYLWVEDAAKALYLIATKSKNHKIYNIGHPDLYSNLKVAIMIQDILGKQRQIEFVKDRPYNDTVYPYGSEPIKRELGWNHTMNLKEFLPITVEWYVKNLNNYKEYKHLL